MASENKSKGRRSARNWDESYLSLVAYKNMHGTLDCPYSHDGCLYRWILSQRKNEPILTASQRSRLESIGFDFELGKSGRQWNEMYDRLKTFMDRFGNAPVPTKLGNSSLCYWVNRQRLLWRENKISEERRDQLGAIGFIWRPRGGRPQGGNGTETTHEKRAGGDEEEEKEQQRDPSPNSLLLNPMSPDGRAVTHKVDEKQDPPGSRVTNRSTPPSSRRKLTGKRPMKSTTHKPSPAATNHRDCEHGDVSTVTSSHDSISDEGLRAGSSKNSGTCAKDRQQEMATKTTELDRIWDGMFEKLKDHSIQHGHSFGPARNEDTKMANWMLRQRQLGVKGKLRKDRAAKLNSIGFVFDVSYREILKASRDEHWQSQFTKVVDFDKKHGHCCLSKDYPDQSLKHWIDKQRSCGSRGLLRQDRKQLLDSIDFFKKSDKAAFFASAGKQAYSVFFSSGNDDGRENTQNAGNKKRKRAKRFGMPFSRCRSQGDNEGAAGEKMKFYSGPVEGSFDTFTI